jgi:dodecin
MRRVYGQVASVPVTSSGQGGSVAPLLDASTIAMIGRNGPHPGKVPGSPRAGSGCEDELTGSQGGAHVSDSIYRVTEVIGTSTESWEDAAKHAVETAAKTLRDLRVGEVVKLDVTIDEGHVTHYRARVAISFKYEHGD